MTPRIITAPPSVTAMGFTAYNNTLRTDVTGDNTAYVIPFDAEYFDQGNCHSGGTFTAPRAGLWLMSATCWFNGGVAHTYWGLVLTQAVGTARTLTTYTYGANSENFTILTGLFKCAVNDTITVTGVVTGGTGTKVIDIPADGSRTTFSGFWVGA